MAIQGVVRYLYQLSFPTPTCLLHFSKSESPSAGHCWASGASSAFFGLRCPALASFGRVAEPSRSAREAQWHDQCEVLHLAQCRRQMPLIWESAGGGARRSSRVRNAASTTPAATQAAADSATALESYAAEASLVEERRRRKEADRADAEEAEADDLSTRSADGTGCGAGAGSIAQRDACGAPPRPMAARRRPARWR